MFEWTGGHNNLSFVEGVFKLIHNAEKNDKGLILSNPFNDICNLTFLFHFALEFWRQFAILIRLKLMESGFMQ